LFLLSAAYTSPFRIQVVCKGFIASGQEIMIAHGSCSTDAHGCPDAVNRRVFGTHSVSRGTAVAVPRGLPEPPPKSYDARSDAVDPARPSAPRATAQGALRSLKGLARG
jgi:hypothetical protein